MKKWIIFAGIIAIVLACTAGVYVNSTSYKIKKELQLGKKYIDNMDYEQAVAAYQRAALLNPEDERVKAFATSSIESMYQVAERYAGAQNFEEEKKLAIFMLQISEESVWGKLANAEAECGNGNIADAKMIYENILEEEPENEKAIEGKEKCEIKDKLRGYEVTPLPETSEEASVLGEILSFCESGDWEKVLLCLNKNEFKKIEEKLAEITKMECVNEKSIVLGISDGVYYVYCGDYVDGKMIGKGVGIIKGKETNSIYSGEWNNDTPSGKGQLTIYGKKINLNEKQRYETTFINGIMDGDTSVCLDANEMEVIVNSEVEQGKIKGFPAEDGLVWLCEVPDENGMALVAEYVNVENDWITDYLAGVPGFGGSDKKLSLVIKDVQAPKLECNLKKGKWTSEKDSRIPNFKKFVTATDNLDGDLTDQIIVDTSHIPHEWNVVGADGYLDNAKGYVIYTVTDSSGNISKLKVSFELWELSEYYDYCMVGTEYQ